MNLSCLKGEMEGLSLDNPYGDVLIPRAQLRPISEDSSTVIVNPLAARAGLQAGHGARASALNPYGSFRPPGSEMPAAMPIYTLDTRSPPPYEAKVQDFTVKEDEEEVSCCYCCCRPCRKK